MNQNLNSPALAREVLAREVLAKRVALVALVTAVLDVAIAMHWLTVAQSDADIAKVTGALDALGTVVGVLYARRAVTPVADPRDADGNAMVPIVAAAVTSIASLPQWSDDEIAAAADAGLPERAAATREWVPERAAATREWGPERAAATREWVPEHAAQPASV